MLNWLLDLIVNSLVGAIESVIEVFGAIINNIFEAMYEINSMLDYSIVDMTIQSFAIAMVSAFAIKQGLEVYVFHTDGDSEADPLELVTRVAMAIAMIRCGSFVIKTCIELAAKMSSEIQDALSELESDQSLSDTIQESTSSLIEGSTVGVLVMIILLAIVVVSLVIFCFQATKRGAELILFQLLIPIFALDLLTTSRERWRMFMTEMCTCVFGYILQMLCFTIFMYLFFNYGNDPSDTNYLIASVGWLLLVIKMPKWIRRFAYNSGAGNGAKAVGRSSMHVMAGIIRSK